MTRSVVTERQNTDVPFDEWDPSPAQAWAATLLAQCHSQTRTAEITGADLRSVNRWWSQPNFREYVRRIQRGILEGYFEEFQFRVAESLIIMGQVFRGEIEATDPRVPLAHDTLKATLYRMATSGDLVPLASQGAISPPNSDGAIGPTTGT